MHVSDELRVPGVTLEGQQDDGADSGMLYWHTQLIQVFYQLGIVVQLFLHWAKSFIKGEDPGL